MGDMKMIFGERIRKRRNQAGLTQEQLAEKAGMHPTYIGQLERGEKNATLESAAKIAIGLGITMSGLFEHLDAGEDRTHSIASECYALVDSLDAAEQGRMLGIIKQIIDYKLR